MASGIPSFFKTPRHRSFEYRPVFYDEQKERKAELEALVAEERSGKVSDDRRPERLRGLSGHRWSAGGRSKGRADSPARTIRLITVVAVLVCLVWVLFYWV